MNASIHPLWRSSRFALLAALALLTAACARFAPQPPPPVSAPEQHWARHIQQVSDLANWRIMGKLGIRTPEQSNSARLNWAQQAEHFDIRVTTLLGQGVMKLSGSSGDVLLNIAGEGEHRTRHPESWLYQQLGWTLPVDALGYWVRGIPAPQTPARYQLNEQGLMASLQQDGWQLSFSRYQGVESLSLPARVLLQRGDIRLTLLIKEWTLEP